MLYLFLNYNYQIKKKWKLCLAYLLCIIIYSFFNLYNSTLVKNDNLYQISLGIFFKNDFLEKLFYLLNTAFCIFMSLNIFLSIRDVRDNIFSRIGNLKLILFNNMYILMFLGVFKFTVHLIVSLITKSNFDLRLLLLDLFFSYMLVLISFIIILVFKNITLFFIVFFFIIILVLIINKDLLFPSYYNIYILLITSSLLNIFNILIQKKVYSLFERMMLK